MSSDYGKTDGRTKWLLVIFKNPDLNQYCGFPGILIHSIFMVWPRHGEVNKAMGAIRPFSRGGRIGIDSPTPLIGDSGAI